MALEGWIVFLATLGFIDSIYTALQQKFDKLFQFCFNKDFRRVNCYNILHSKYANVFVIPNSWIGIAGYLLMILIFATGYFIWIGKLIALAALAFSLYLFYVQESILEKFCIFCLASTTLIIIINVLIWV